MTMYGIYTYIETYIYGMDPYLFGIDPPQDLTRETSRLDSRTDTNSCGLKSGLEPHPAGCSDQILGDWNLQIGFEGTFSISQPDSTQPSRNTHLLDLDGRYPAVEFRSIC